MRHIALLFALIMGLVSAPTWGEVQWYKGVTHVHSLWSDGNQAPEMITKWYKDRGYNFVCFSEHNVLQQGAKHMSIADGTKVSPERVQEIVDTFGEGWVEIEETSINPRLKLKTHEELSAYFNEDEKFLLINAEEVTSVGQSPHFNVINLRENIVPSRGPVSTVLQQYIDATREQSERLGVPMIGHLNHMNWSDTVTSEEVLATRGLRFFEVYNGHSGVNTWGHAAKFLPSSERHWDIILSMRQENEPGEVLYGLATDDSHEYFEWGRNKTNPGRGWVMVRAGKLDPNSITEALDRGEFYSSTGVALKDFRSDGQSLTVEIDAKPGATYTTRFIGTRKGFDASSGPVLDENGEARARTTRIYSGEIGQVLHETTDNPATYVFSGNEIYVRATVISDVPQDNGVREEDVEMAWVQPVMLP